MNSWKLLCILNAVHKTIMSQALLNNNKEGATTIESIMQEKNLYEEASRVHLK